MKLGQQQQQQQQKVYDKLISMHFYDGPKICNNFNSHHQWKVFRSIAKPFGIFHTETTKTLWAQRLGGQGKTGHTQWIERWRQCSDDKNELQVVKSSF